MDSLREEEDGETEDFDRVTILGTVAYLDLCVLEVVEAAGSTVSIVEGGTERVAGSLRGTDGERTLDGVSSETDS